MDWYATFSFLDNGLGIKTARTLIYEIVLTAIFAMLASLTAQATQANSSTQNSTASPAIQPNAAAQPANRMRIAPGSVIPVQLSKTLDAKKLKPGDEVYAEVTQDLKAGNGEIIVPKNTKITGKVTEAQARNKQEKESQVGIAFDHAGSKRASSQRGAAHVDSSRHCAIVPEWK